MNFQELKFRAHSFGDIMCGVSKNKPVEKSETCKGRLISMWDEYVNKRVKLLNNKFLEKGTLQEEVGITLASRVMRYPFKKNEERRENDYFTCIPDSFYKEDSTVDFKCSYSRETFLKAKFSEIDTDYEYQGRIQMDVWGKTKHILVYCLVNTPAHLIDKEKRFNNPFEVGSKNYIKREKQIEINHIFNLEEFKRENPDYCLSHLDEEWVYDIPLNDRCFRFEFDSDSLITSKMKSRVDECRIWMENHLK